ncbi:MAG: 50S ribosomal protein L11 methyltransferase [Burkholderiales bacterium]
MPWLELTLEVDAAWAEPLSEALLAAGAQSVWLGEPAAGRSALGALLAEATDAAALVARARAASGAPVAGPLRTRRIEDQDWVRATQAQFTPQRVAEGLWIVPSWHEAPVDATVIRLDPGLAFGTGSHPTTRLVLAWLAKRRLTGCSVLDYGCGSGILSIAAAKLGAARVDAVDLDPDALAATGANARANAADVHAFAPEGLPSGAYDFVVANILTQPLILLEPLLAARSRAGGGLALAGILEAQAGEVTAAYAVDFDIAVIACEEGWSLLEGRRR